MILFSAAVVTMFVAAPSQAEVAGDSNSINLGNTRSYSLNAGDSTDLTEAKKNAFAKIGNVGGGLPAPSRVKYWDDISLAKDVQEINDILANAKDEYTNFWNNGQNPGKITIDMMDALLEEQKTHLYNEIDATVYQWQVDQAIKYGQAQNYLNLGNLDAAKTAINTAINSDQNLSTDEKAKFTSNVESQKTVVEFQTILNLPIVNQPAVQAAQNLQNAQKNDKETISNTLKNLSQKAKDFFNGQIDKTTTIDDAAAILKAAQNYNSAPITVNYVKQDDSDKLLKQVTIPTDFQQVGDQYDVSTAEYKAPFTASDGKDYVIDNTKLPSNSKGTFTENPQTVTYYVSTKQADAKDVTIHYYEKGTTTSLQPDKVLSGVGKYGDSFDVDTENLKPSIINNYYQYDSTSGATSGTFGDQPHTITFFYTRPDAKTVTVEYVDKNGKPIHDPQIIGKGDKVGDEYDATNRQYKLETIIGSNGVVYSLNTDNLPSNAKGKLSDQAIKVVYEYKTTKAAPVTIQYVDEDGNVIHAAEALDGVIGERFDARSHKMNTISYAGNTYTLDVNKSAADSSLNGIFSADKQTIKFVYSKNITPINPVVPVEPINPVSPVNPLPNPLPKPTPAPTPLPQIKPESGLPNYAATKGSATSPVNHIYLYKHSNFKKSDRIAEYVKKPRIYRPMFVVTDYARSITGKLRYKVTDVNHRSKTAGKSGYVTASWKYVRPVYYASKHSKITVISPTGVNAYKTEALTGKVKNYKQGTVLNVKGMVKHNLTTRYILTNGKYVTANRKLVNMGRHKTVKKVRAKTTINRYKNVNLSRRNQTYKKGEVFKVYNYDYSHGYNLQKHGALRYHVAGGYITGNSKYVKVIR